MVDVKPFLSLHPHHGHMEDSEIDEDLGPYAASLTHFIDYSHIYLMAKETSERMQLFSFGSIWIIYVAGQFVREFFLQFSFPPGHEDVRSKRKRLH